MKVWLLKAYKGILSVVFLCAENIYLMKVEKLDSAVTLFLRSLREERLGYSSGESNVMG